MRQGDLDRAIASYQNASRDNPDFYCIYQNLGEALARQGKIDEAIQAYQAAIAANCHAVKAYYDLIVLWKRKGGIEEASEIYLSAIQCNPSFSSDRVFHLIFNPYNQPFYSYVLVRKELKKLQNQNPILDPWESPYMAANHIKERESTDAAIEAYQYAIALHPNDHRLWVELGDLWYVDRKWQEAEFCYQRGVELQPKCSWYYYKLGQVLVGKNKFLEAEAVYQASIDIEPQKYYEVYYEFGKLCNHLKKWDRAYSMLQVSTTLHPKHLNSYWEWGRAAFYLEKWDEVIDVFNRYVNLGGEESHTWEMVGRALRERMQDNRDGEKAVEVYMKAINKNPQNLQLYFDILAMNIDDMNVYLQLRDVLRQTEVKNSKATVKATLNFLFNMRLSYF